MNVGRVCSRFMATILPDGTVEEAAVRMASLGVDTLVVLAEDGFALGVVTDRDLVIRCIARGGAPRETFVLEIMTTPVPPGLAFEFPDEREAGDRDADAGRLVRGAEYETLTSLLALDDALHLVQREMDREGGHGPRDTHDTDGGTTIEDRLEPRPPSSGPVRPERRRRGREPQERYQPRL